MIAIQKTTLIMTIVFVLTMSFQIKTGGRTMTINFFPSPSEVASIFKDIYYKLNDIVKSDSGKVSK